MSEGEVILSLKMVEGIKFKRIIDALSAVLTRARFEFTEAGMFLRATNASKIAYVEMNLPATSFNEYRCVPQVDEESEETTPVRIDINIDDLQKIVTRCGQNDSITITHHNVSVAGENGENVMQPSEKIDIKLEGEVAEGRRRSRTFQLNQEEVPSMFIPEGNIHEIIPLYQWNIEIDTDALEAVIKDAEAMSDAVSIKVEKTNEIEFSAWSELGNYKEPISQGISVGLNEGTTTPRLVKCDFEIEILKNMLKMGKESNDQLQLQMGVEAEKDEHDSALPLRIVINVLTDGVINYFIAPKSDD